MVLVPRIGHAATYSLEARVSSTKEQQDGTLVRLYTIDFIEPVSVRTRRTWVWLYTEFGLDDIPGLA
jgi:hypothetical protein